MNNKLLVVTAVLLVATFAVTLSASFSDGDPVTGTDNEFDTKDEAKDIPGAIWTNNGHPMYVRETFDFTVGNIAYSYAEGGVEVSPWYWSWLPHNCTHTDHTFAGTEYSGQKIVIPTSVTYLGREYNVVGIGDSAFWNANGFSVTFPTSNSFTYIGNQVFFQNSPAMSSIEIPATVTTIGSKSFSLNDNSIPVTIAAGSRLQTIGDEAFANNSAITELAFPDTLKSIGSLAFQNCTSLGSITIPKSVNSIQTYTFDGYYKLDPDGTENVVFEEGSIFQIQDGVLYDPECLIRVLDWQANVVVPDGILYIGPYAFNTYTTDVPNSMTILKFITFPDSLVSIGKSAFCACQALESVTIPANVTEIGNGAFSECTRLKTVIIEAQLTGLPNSMFSGCVSLEHIELPPTITTIGNSTFSGCSDLESFDFSNIDSIGESAFLESGLISFDGATSSMTMGESAFGNCLALESIVIPEGMNISYGAFAGCVNVETVLIPSEVTVGDGAFFGVTNAILIFEGTEAPTLDNNSFTNPGMGVSTPSAKKIVIPEGSSGYDTLFPNVTSIEYPLDLVSDSAAICVGGSSAIDLSLSYELTLAVESDSECVDVSIDGSRITIVGLSPGNATVVASLSINGVEFLSDSCDVAVESVIAEPTVTIAGNTDAYEGQNVTLTANVSGTYDSTTYQWYSGADPIQNETGQTLTVTQSGDYRVEVTVTTAAGQTESVTSETFTVTFHEWALPSGTMTLYPGFPAFYPLDYVASDLKIEFKEGSNEGIITIEGSLIEYNAGYGRTTIVLKSGSLNPLELTIDVLREESGIAVSGDTDKKPVVEVPNAVEKQNTREEISNQVYQNEELSSAIPQSAISNGTIVDIKVPDEDGMPVQTETELTVPYSWFGAGISYSNHGGFNFYIVHYHDGRADWIEDLTFGAEGVSFTVKGFSPFLFASEEVAGPVPDPDYPLYPDTDDDYPFIPPTVVDDGDSDEMVKIVACAAAAAAVAIMAMFLVVDYRKK